MIYLAVMKDFLKRHIRPIVFAASILLTILLGVVVGIILVYQKGFPQQIKNLEDIKPVVMTTIYDRSGTPVHDFAIEKRRIVRRTDLPDVLIQSLVASEDQQFYSHWGINFKGTFRAILGQIFGRDRGGGSSITQQLARGLFLTPRVTMKRKLNEMLLAIQIEKNYSKEQIITFYCNQIFLGGSVYGVEAAAKYYFGKSIHEVSVEEAALLTALIPTPNVLYSVFRNLKGKEKRVQYLTLRRNRILRRMYAMGFIDQSALKTAEEIGLPEKPFDSEQTSVGDYYLEEVRRYLESKYGDNLLYKGGLKVFTSLDMEMQVWAETALKEGLRQLDKRKGWRNRPALPNLIKNGEDIETIRLPGWQRLKLRPSEIVKGIVTRVSSRRALVRIDGFTGLLNARDAAWAKQPLHRILKKGDVALFRILEVPPGIDAPEKEGEPGKKPSLTLKLGLEQEPEVQGAIMVVDNQTGQVRAMVGGYDFAVSEFNNATQAGRQTGSTFKPIIYTAALEHGYTPATIIIDEPFSYYDAKIDEIWEPRNITLDFLGPLTLRRALQKSRNVISAKLVEQLTPVRIVDYAHRFGITSDLKPFMSIALGSFGVSLKEMVGAYTVFPNLGTRVTPYLVRNIRDQNGHIVEEDFPDRKLVVDQETAFVMNYLLQGVVQMGSGWRARHLEAPIGGKTGTTNDNTDAWFIGFSPSVTVGVWVGYSIPRSLGEFETGSRAAAPIFVHFMEKYLEKFPEEKGYRKPPGVVFIKVDGFTGKLWTSECIHPLNEAFINGTEPTEFCRPEEHMEFHGYYDNIPDTEESPETATPAQENN